MHHRTALAWAGVLGASGRRPGGLRRARPKGDAGGGGNPRRLGNRVPVPTSACRGPAWVCGLGEGLARGTRRVRRLGPPPLGRGHAPLLGLALRPRAWGAALARARRRRSAGAALIAGWALAAGAALAGLKAPPPTMPATDGAPPLPDELRAMLEAVRRVGRPRLVGGGVRDWLLGSPSKDFDIEVAGRGLRGPEARPRPPSGPPTSSGAASASSRFAARRAPSTTSASRAASRRPGPATAGSPSGPTPWLGDAEAAARRDFTVNAISVDPVHRGVFDPSAARADLRARILRHTSPAFARTPCGSCAPSSWPRASTSPSPRRPPPSAARWRRRFAELPVERVWGEWDKWAVKSVRPSRGLAVLEETGWIRHFPEVAALRGTPQEPEWHPEGDVLTHTGHCLDALVSLDGLVGAARPPADALVRRPRPRLREALDDRARGAARRDALAEPGPRGRGRPRWPTRSCGASAPRWTSTPRCGRWSSTTWPTTTASTATTRTPRSAGSRASSSPRRSMTSRSSCPRTRWAGRRCRLRASWSSSAACARAPRPWRSRRRRPGRIIQGRHLVALGRRPGPAFKPILDAAFEAQLDGAFGDEAGGLAWLREHSR